jgi:O-antigen/teichoic acid export membrane protein
MYFSLKMFNLLRHDPQLLELFLKSYKPFLVRIMGVACNFGFTFLISRLLGASGAGIFFLTIPVVMISTVFSRLGLDYAVLRLVSSSAAGGKWSLVAGIYRTASGVTLLAAVVITIFLFVFSSQLAVVIFKEPALVYPLRWMTLSVVPFSLMLIQSAAFKAVSATSMAIFIQHTGIPLLCFLMLGAVAFFSPAVHTVCQIYVLACVVIFFGAAILWRRKAAVRKITIPLYSIRSLMTLSTPFFWVSILHLLNGSLDIVMLGIWHESSVVGIYGIANRVVALTGLLFTVVESVVAPKFSALYSQGRMHEIQIIANRSLLILLILGLPVLLIFFLFAGKILAIFGEQFIAAAPILKILAVGQFVNVVTGTVGYLLMMTGHEKILRNNIFFSALLNISLNVLLVPKFGGIGAAIATASTLAFHNLACLYFTGKKLNISIFKYS